MSPSHKIVNFAEKNLTRLPFVEVDNFLDERRKERRRIDLVLKILKQTCLLKSVICHSLKWRRGVFPPDTFPKTNLKISLPKLGLKNKNL